MVEGLVFLSCKHDKVVPGIVSRIVVKVMNVHTFCGFRSGYPGVNDSVHHRATTFYRRY